MAKKRRQRFMYAAECQCIAIAAFVLCIVFPCVGKERELPRSFSMSKDQERIERRILPGIDNARLLREDGNSQKNWYDAKPLRFAVPVKVQFTLENAGTWNRFPDGSRVWRLRIQVPNAKNLSLGITDFEIPEGGRLWVYTVSHDLVQGPYTSRDRSPAGRLWTAVTLGSEVVLEVFLPSTGGRAVVEIGEVNCGYRNFAVRPTDSGEVHCNTDVICPASKPWKDQIRSVAIYSVDGSLECTGQMLNNARKDFKPYFLSANHCEVNESNADTVVVYWNYLSPTCGSHAGGDLTQNQSGAFFRATSDETDFLLLELVARPDPSFHVFYSGWDATGEMPRVTLCIHHPDSAVKVMDLSHRQPLITSYGGAMANPTGGYWRVHWDSGATDRGSSGSCLWNADTGRCIGQLRGGTSSCLNLGKSGYDFFSGLAHSWNGEVSAKRLRDWLDPSNTGVLTLNGLDQ
jgi:hypothetical protein